MGYDTDKKIRIKDLKSLALKAAGEWQTINSSFITLKNNTSLINNDTMPLENRNAIWGGRSLGNFTETHYDNLVNHNGKGLFVGDRFLIPNMGDKITYWDFWVRIAGFKQINGWQNTMILIPQYALGQINNNMVLTSEHLFYGYNPYYNSAAIGTEGEDGYVPSTLGNLYPQSNWYTYLRPIFEAKMQEFFLNHLLDFTITVPSGYDENGNLSSVVNLTAKAHLPTISMVYGWQCPGLMELTAKNGTVIRYFQRLPLFRLYDIARNVSVTSSTYWTGQCGCAETISPTRFLGTHSYTSFANGMKGFLTNQAAENNGYKTNLRPIFCIG